MPMSVWFGVKFTPGKNCIFFNICKIWQLIKNKIIQVLYKYYKF
jgi:hypothetical protein